MTQSEKDFQKDESPSREVLYRSEELLQGRRQVVIKHGGTQYRLSVTKAGKLILNK